jgi:phage FluMu protein Com
MFVGYRSGHSKYLYLGMLKCPNCKNVAEFYIYEKAFKPTVMFIPIAKFNKSYLLACESCKSGREISEQEVIKIKNGQ